MPTFRAKIRKVGPGYWVDVPVSVIGELSATIPIPVIVRYAGDAHASTVTSGGRGHGRLALRADVFRAGGFAVGGEIAITLTLDRTPRTLTVPSDLQRALAFRPAAEAGWQHAAPSTRRVLVEQLNAVRTEETRARRIEKLVELFAEKAAARKKK